jgi:hypothetical protein
MRRLLLGLLVCAGCHHDPQPMHAKPGELPPLPPASGTPIGYLIDAQTDLQLRDDQLTTLKQLDTSLAANDAEIDTQLRQIEPQEEEEELTPQQVKAGQKRHHKSHAPGSAGPPTGDAARLHGIRDSADRDALKKAWAVLDPDQQTKAKPILEQRGVEIPGEGKKKPPTSDDGQPMPGMEP